MSTAAKPGAIFLFTFFFIFLIFFLILASARIGNAQSSQNDSVVKEHSQMNPTPVMASTTPAVAAASAALLLGTDPENQSNLTLLKHLAGDQRQFWARPKEFSAADSAALLPFIAFTGLLVANDRWIAQQVPNRPDQLQRSQDISNYGVYALAGAAGGSWLWGKLVKNDHLQESGGLSGEAAINSAAVAYALSAITQRSRPDASTGNGFFRGGNSFPSDHSAVAWSLASVLAHEYPGRLTQFVAYGLASAVTLTRVTSQQHFASDAFVGSALGWYLGRQVYRAHHDPELGGGPWGVRAWEAIDWKSHGNRHDASHPWAGSMASPYEPLDSWVYPAFERLIAMGYVENAYLDQRPWTRMECARLLEDAGERLSQNGAAQDSVRKLYRALSEEFAAETRRRDGESHDQPDVHAAVDSVYTRATDLSGPALDDGFHFGQTLVNDYGRPYASGVSSMAGFSSELTAGPLAFYVRAEYQQAPASAPYSAAVLQATAQADGRPFMANPNQAISQPDLLESLVALDFHDLQLSFGKQSAWLSPSRSGSLLLSNNAPPFLMFRIDQTTPYEIPLLSRLLGPARSEFFLGQLSGQQFVYNGSATLGPNLNPQPFLHGDRISFQPSANLEFGMGVAVMFGGPGLPFTWKNFLRTYYLHSTNTSVNPGKRFSAFDFTYRIPGLRKWLTFYIDSLVVDEFSPIGSSRPSLNPGLYSPQIPKLQKLEIRLEGLKTAQAPHVDFPPGYVYTDRRYLSGYTNDGELLGSWIGRAGIGGQAWTTYHLSARNTLEASFRHMEVDHSFLAGGHLNDFSLESQLQLRPGMILTSRLQYERWAFPLLAPQPQRNLTTSLQISFSPRFRAEKRALAATRMGATGATGQP